MMAARTLLMACALAPAVAWSSEFLADMRPEVVSKLLSQVEHQWTEKQTMVLVGKADSKAALAEMAKSCMKVGRSIIAGSDGDEDRVSEYMKEVCDAAGSTDKDLCNSFSAGIQDAMIGDSVYNRETLDLSKFCGALWNGAVQTAAKAQKEKIDADEADRAKVVEAAEKAADEKAAEEKAAEDAKAAEAKKVADAKLAGEQKVERAVALQAEGEVEANKAKVMAEKAQNATASIEKVAAEEETNMDAASGEAKELQVHAQTALRVATQKEAAAVKKAAEEKAAEVKKAAEDKVAEVKKEAEDKVAEVKKVAEDKVAEVKKVAEEKAAAVKDAANKTVAVMAANKTVAVATNTTKPEKKLAQLQQDPCAGCAEAFVAQHQKCMATMSNNPCTKQYTGVAFDNQCCGMAQQHARCMSCKSQGSRPHYNSKWTDQLNSGVTVTEGYSK